MRIILAVILILTFSETNGQEKYPIPEYFYNVKADLKSREDIKDIRFYQTNYMNGNLKYQQIHLNYMTDPMKRNWIVGPAFQYYKNGNIKVREYFDLNNNLRIDTGYVYYRNGSVKQIFINLNGSAYSPIPSKVIFKNIWYYNPIRFGIINTRENGNKRNEFIVKFLDDKYILDGYFTSYDKEGKIIKKKKYINGKRIKEIKNGPM